MRALAGEQDDTAVGRRDGGAECGGRGPADRAPERLVIEGGAGGHARETQAHGGGAGFGDEDVVGAEEAFPARIKRVQR